MDPKIMTKIEAAVGSATRVFLYAICVYLSATVALQATTGGGQVPNLETLKGWGIGALYAGGTALVSFGKNMLAPRSQIVQGTK